MLGWVEIVIRSLLVIIALFILTKWLGKKQISQLSFFEYITGITIGSIAAEASFDETLSLFHGITALIIWAIIPYFSGYFSLKSKRVRNIVEGKATVFIQDGKILEDNLKKEKYTIDELMEQLRKNNVFNVADVQFALLEPGGDVSVLLKKEKQPLTASDLNLKVAPIKQPEIVIMDGVMLDEPLATLGFSRSWLQNELDKKGVSIENVFVAQVDSYGQVHVDLYDDLIDVPQPTELPLLLATLKKCQADLELYGLATEQEKVATMYKQRAEQLNVVIKEVTPYLQK